MDVRTSSTGRKALMSVAVVGAAAAVAGLGTFGSFNSTTSASAAVSAGTVQISLGGDGTANNRLTVSPNGLVPGDTVQRQVQLVNGGNQALAGIVLSTAASTSSVLDTNTTNGLQLIVEACSVPWAEAGTAPAYTYTCAGTASTVLTTRPVIGSNMALPNLASVNGGGADNLRVKMTLPTAADNTFQGNTSTISFAFAGTQRGATDR